MCRGRRLEVFGRMTRLQRLVRRQYCGDALQLADQCTNREDDEAADRRRGPGDDQRIAEAELFYRDAVSNAPEAQKSNNGADNNQ